MKIKFFKIKKDYKKENYEVNFNTYWKIIVIFSFLALVASFIFAFNFFTQTNKEGDLTFGKNSGEISNTEKERVKNAIDYFSEKEKKSIEILNSLPAVIDPSL
jgi:hypothetical protein